MKTISTLIILLTALLNVTVGQVRTVESPYSINYKLDIPLAAAGVGLTTFGFYGLSQKSSSDSLDIVELSFYNDNSDMNTFNGPNYSEAASNASDYLFYGAMPLPALLFFDKNMRRDAGQITVMYLQALGLTGTMYTFTASNIDKYRPLAYSTAAPFSERKEGNAKNSFFAGHPAVTATSMFFMAKVVSDYYPERTGLRWFMYGSAAIASAANGYLRMEAGKHFLTDVIVGITVGALNGTLVPHFHKKGNKKLKNLSWNIFSGEAHGVALNYNIR